MHSITYASARSQSTRFYYKVFNLRVSWGQYIQYLHSWFSFSLWFLYISAVLFRKQAFDFSEREQCLILHHHHHHHHQRRRRLDDCVAFGKMMRAISIATTLPAQPGCGNTDGKAVIAWAVGSLGSSNRQHPGTVCGIDSGSLHKINVLDNATICCLSYFFKFFFTWAYLSPHAPEGVMAITASLCILE